MFWIWLVLGIALLAAEAHTNQLYALFLAIGAFAAAIADLAHADPFLQVLGGALIAFLGAVLVRPAIRQYLEARSAPPFPGVQNLVGQRAMTVDTVGDEHHPGHVMLAGERWLAVSDAGPPLPADQTVTIISVRGTTLLVRPSVPSASR